MSLLFEEKILQRGKVGKQWLRNLPRIVEELKACWHLAIGLPFQLNFNYVVPVITQDGVQAILKIVFPRDQEYISELDALRLYNGIGAVGILATHETYKALLLEYAIPGTPLSTLDNDEKIITILTTTMKKLWRPAPMHHRFSTITDWVQSIQRYRDRFKGQKGPLPNVLVNKAEQLFMELIQSTNEQVVCHGDLHPGNVLLSQRGWIAIDPKGVVADPAYEPAVLLLNSNINGSKSILKKRICQMANKLGIKSERIYRWGFAHTVLSAIWYIEDNSDDGWKGRVKLARLFDRIEV